MKEGHLFAVVYKGSNTTHCRYTIIVDGYDINKTVHYIPTGKSGDMREIVGFLESHVSKLYKEVTAKVSNDLRTVMLFNKGIVFAKLSLIVAGEYKQD